MVYKHFENRFREFLEIGNPDIVNFLKEKYSDIKANNYYSFLDMFLNDYGVISINIYGPTDIDGKFNPYIKFDAQNIFKEDEGIFDLSPELLDDVASENLMANYLIQRLNFLKVSDFFNWYS